MFLKLLTDEEKRLFLNLAIYIASVDNDFTDKEKEKIKVFCKEMEIECENFITKLSLNDVLDKLNFLEVFKKKIVLLEIVCLMLVDGLVKEEEKVLDQMIEKFGLDISLKDKMIKWCQKYNQILLEGYLLIGEEVRNG